MDKLNDFTLLIPTYNPADGWEFTFNDRYLEFCALIGEKVNVVLINDGSRVDLTTGVKFLSGSIGEKFQSIGYDLNKGKGAALKYGVSSLPSKKYMFTDFDFPYVSHSMKEVWHVLQNKNGIITGYRDQSYYRDITFYRKILSKGLRWLNQKILRLPINDTQCGLKAFDSEVGKILLSCKTDRFLTDLELLLASNKQKIEITPVSVVLRNDIASTQFNSSVLKNEFRNLLKLIWQYRL